MVVLTCWSSKFSVMDELSMILVAMAGPINGGGNFPIMTTLGLGIGDLMYGLW